MSAKYKSPSFLLPNELNTSANTANDTGINSLYSMKFDGSNSVNCGNISALNGATQATWSCWYKKTASGAKNFMGNWGSGANTKQFLPYQYSSGMEIYMGNNASGSPSHKTMFSNLSCGISQDNWHHMTFVFDASESSNADKLKFYLNGTQITNNAAGFALTSLNSVTTDFILGAPFSPYLTGNLDEVAIFNRALDTAEIAALYGGTSPNIYPSNLMASNLGPIAYYPLGEQAQNSGYPSATGNEWQFPNGVLQDYVMDFDGTSPGDAITSNTSGITGNAARTVSFWYNIGSSSSAMIPFSLGGINDTNSNSQFAYCLNREDNSTYAAIFGRGGNDISPITVPATNDSKWHNVIITYTGSTLALYIDGSNITLPSQPSSYATTDGFKIGGWSEAGNRLFDGQLSNIAIWNTDQSTNIANIYNNGSPQTSYTVTPQNWWKLNADSVYTPSAPNYTTALDFNSTNTFVNVGALSNFITNNVTVSLWANFDTLPSSYDGNLLISAQGTSWDQGLGFVNTNPSGNIRFFIENWDNSPAGTGGFVDNTTTITTNQWYHFCGTWDGSTVKYYINGDLQGSASYTGSITTTHNLLIGTAYNPANGIDGKISNTAIFNSALTATQVSSLFNFGTPETNISFSPAAWWKLDDQNAITDSSGNGHTGTNNGATNSPGGVAYVPSWKIPSALPITTTPNYTTALDFDGSDFIDLGRPASLNLMPSVDEFSISAWFKTSAQGTIYSFGAPSSNSNTQIKIAIRGGDYLPEVVLKGTATTIGSTTYNDGNWHNIVLTCTTSTANLYIDGSNVGSPTIGTATITSTDNGAIGARTAPTGGFFFNGSISNVSICNTNLSASQVSTLYNNGTPETAISFSPVSWWKLDTGGSTITDYGSGGNNGTNDGASPITSDVLTPQPVNGVSTTLPSTALQQSDLQFDSPFSNYSLSFDGAGGYIDCTDNDMFSFGNGTTDSPFSVSFWAKLNSVSGTQPFLSKDTANPNREWAISIFSDSSNGVRIFLKNQGGNSQQSIDSSTALTTGVWYHITTTYDGRGGSDAADGLNIYINGILDTPTNISKGTYTAMSNTTAPVYIGKYSSSEINGKIDETAIFNTALTEAQVLEIYNNGKPGDLDNFSGTAPISWWRLGENAYFNTGTTPGPEFTVPNSIAGAPNGVGSGTVTSMLSADAPGTYANGIGDGLAITDRVGDAPLSVANSQSYNMIPDDKVPYVPGYVGAQTTNAFEMTFDGVDAYVDARSVTSFGVNDFTVSIWVKGTDTSSAYYLGSDPAPYNSTGFGIGRHGSLPSSYLGSPRVWIASSVINGTTNVNDGNWHNVIVTRESGGVRIYVDGAEEVLHDDSNNIISSPYTMNGTITVTKTVIGALTSSMEFWSGSIDEVALFDEALTADQIKFDLYEPTTTGKTADIENNTNLPTPVAWYRMGD
jgi:hypothetical protein